MEIKTNNDVENAVASLKTVKTVKPKNQKKKKQYSKLVVDWPKTPFTISDLQKMNESAVNITLRHRINQAKDKGDVVEIGKNITHLGRPTLIFCKTPVKKELLAHLDKDVVLNSEYEAILKGTTVAVAKFSKQHNKHVVQPNGVIGVGGVTANTL